jgi:hypothetical protein
MLRSILLCACFVALVNPLLNTAGSAGSDVTLSGTAKTCFNGTTVPVGNVAVGFYNVTNARPLIAHLDSMAHFPGFGTDGADSVAANQFDALESTMQRMAFTTTAILRRTSAANGTFSITISPVDSVLVVGYANMEDEPYVWDYKVMPGNVSKSFILDMSRGQCGF